MENEVINSLIENNGEEYVTSNLNDVLHDSYSEQFIRDFIVTFEDNRQKKAPKVKKKKEETVFDSFMEEEQNADAIARAA